MDDAEKADVPVDDGNNVEPTLVVDSQVGPQQDVEAVPGVPDTPQSLHSQQPSPVPTDPGLRTPIDLEKVDLGDDDDDDDVLMDHAEPPPALSKGAANARLRRVFNRRSDGSYQVPEEALAMWKDKDKRASLEKMFERCAYNAVSCLH